MKNAADFEPELRDRILKAPESILEDRDLMRALVSASERAMGENVVDLRGIAMDRLEARLDRLEDTHQTVIAAAYENLSGMHAVHRAVLCLLDARNFEDFLARLSGEAADCMRLDAVRLVLETRGTPEVDVARRVPVIHFAEPGFCAGYAARQGGRADRVVTLRQIARGEGELYGDRQDAVRSEAAIRLDLGAGRLPGMVLLGSTDPAHLRAGQATDLLTFLGGAIERTLRRWLA